MTRVSWVLVVFLLLSIAWSAVAQSDDPSMNSSSRAAAGRIAALEARLQSLEAQWGAARDARPKRVELPVELLCALGLVFVLWRAIEWGVVWQTSKRDVAIERIRNGDSSSPDAARGGART